MMKATALAQVSSDEDDVPSRPMTTMMADVSTLANDNSPSPTPKFLDWHVQGFDQLV